MLVLKNKDTNLFRGERRTLIFFLFLYSFFSIVILLFSAFIYYNLQKELMLENQTNRLQEDSFKFISSLRYTHEHFDENQYYPRFLDFKSAIYDSSKKLIFTTLDEDSVNLDKAIYKINNHIHYVRLLESYYLGAMYLVIEVKDDGRWLAFVKSEIIAIGLIFFLILLFVGYFLSKIMLKPMHNTLSLLDRFIKDTTHELNTPISTILTNVEMIDEVKLDPALARKIRRIDIASRTISNLYKDLTYIALGNTIASENKNIDLYDLFNERIEFFKVISSVKHLECRTDLKKDIYLYMDRVKLTRVIDNLLSNAIKYNKKKGYIKITLRENYFEIKDSGIGIKEADVNKIFERYTRFNDSEGGFGLGLNIVMKIAHEYNLEIIFDSKLGIGTKVRVQWKNKK